jgi:hypothetical protein
MKRVYEEIKEYTDQEIKDILERQVVGELSLLPLSLGLFHHNWKVAQHLCIELAKHEDARVRANSVFGLAHIARTKGQLDKRLVP